MNIYQKQTTGFGSRTKKNHTSLTTFSFVVMMRCAGGPCDRWQQVSASLTGSYWSECTVLKDSPDPVLLNNPQLFVSPKNLQDSLPLQSLKQI